MVSKWQLNKVKDVLNDYGVTFKTKVKDDKLQLHFPQQDFYKLLDWLMLINRQDNELHKDDVMNFRELISECHIQMAIDIFLDVCDTGLNDYERPFEYNSENFEIIVSRNAEKLVDYIYSLIDKTESLSLKTNNDDVLIKMIYSEFFTP